MKRVLFEWLLVAAVGICLSFIANALSPRGLKLSRNYFQDAPVPGGTSTNALPAGTNSLELLTARLKAKGIGLGDSNKVAELFQDPRHQADLVIFIDARNDDHYQNGHIPKAYQLDYYRPEKYLPAVLPASAIAEQIVIYCNGGNCEDSEFASTLLRDAGIPVQKLVVYGGGFTEWQTNGMPVEIGERNSGRLKQKGTS